jgi:threonine aldolase
METIDLRSDTVTLPTEEMRQVMAGAEVGDDVFGEDPTVNRLEAEAARCMGKEAALFVPSGTMANLSALLTHCGRGAEVILGDQSHIFLKEAGGLAALGGLNAHTLPNLPDGTMDLGQIEAAIRDEDVHHPRTRLICVENTHNRCSGAPLPLEYMDALYTLAKKHDLAVHLDGARIFNAAVALNTDAKEIARYADSVSFCLSKGLSAPVGSLLCGKAGFIDEARRMRKILGGGMRQAGIIAAAGLMALEQQVDRLAEDHENAKRLAEGIGRIPGLEPERVKVRTNILYFDLTLEGMTQETFLERLAAEAIRVLHTAPYRFRMVTHFGITAAHVEEALKRLERVMAAK